ncbi:MAG: VIT1/CCC1 transporter family protein [Devosia sp.]
MASHLDPLTNSPHPDRPRINYLRDWIYGGIDGVVTTFAIMAGVVGAELAMGVVVVLGLANILADGFSMAAANYSGTKAERDDYERIRAIEERLIREHPDAGRKKLRKIYERKGLTGEDLDRMVTIVAGRKDFWLHVVLAEGHGITEVQRSPLLAALATFAAFIVCGLVPLVPFMLGLSTSAIAASAMSGVMFLGIGAVKSRWSAQSWWASALETFAIGMLAAGIAYAVGLLLRQIVPV